jgi:hypothetical protein
MYILAHLTTTPFVHAPSVDFSDLLDFVVYGAGELTVWHLSALLDDSDFLRSFATRPAAWPAASHAFRVSTSDAAGMFVCALRNESTAVVNLGTSIAYVDLDTGVMLEQDLQMGELLNISRVDSEEDDALVLTVRSLDAMQLRVVKHIS